MIVAVVLGMAFGVVAAVAARSRGRSLVGWFLAGMVIGPFALVVALLPAVAHSGVTAACPRCAEVIAWDAELCRYCGEAQARRPAAHLDEEARRPPVEAGRARPASGPRAWR